MFTPAFRTVRACACSSCVLGLAGLAAAQGPIFQTPGTPRGVHYGQTDRFSSDFNPAISLVFDILGSYADADDPDDDGFLFELRTLELTGAAYVDPSAWAYAVLVGGEAELGVEEAAVVYTGLGGNNDLRAGRFFVDFGKQMQAHVHDLRTIDRPLVLRNYLGDELSGDGLQWDNWFAAGDETAVRYSLGMFQSLVTHGHGEGEEEDDDDHGAEIVEPGRKDFDELGFTARLTGFRDVGESSILQAGASARFLPDFTFESDEDGIDPVDGNSNTVWGFDLTYGWKSDDGNRSLTAGGEYLIQSGDYAAEVVDVDGVETLEVLDDDFGGFYVFADYGWNPNHSAGLQWSLAELAEEDTPEANEYDVYYTWYMTELRRLRFGVTLRDVEDGDDSVRFAIQFTNFLGVHAHGVNW